jgi:hypothetical protein
LADSLCVCRWWESAVHRFNTVFPDDTGRGDKVSSKKSKELYMRSNRHSRHGESRLSAVFPITGVSGVPGIFDSPKQIGIGNTPDVGVPGRRLDLD